jgi:hypothetical protein
MHDDTEAPDDATLTRNWSELLQELRVVQTGVQILTGFLLTVPFTERFGSLDHTQRTIYLAVLVGSTSVTGLVVAPVAFHRVLFRQRQRWWLVGAANLAARAGLLLLAPVSAGVVTLVFAVVVSTPAGFCAGGAVLAALCLLWWVAPAVGHAQVPARRLPDAGPRREQ